MKSFEPVYKELEELFIQKLPDYIEKINKEHNDGIILNLFHNKKLDEDCLRLPYFKFGIEESELSEKDRIIENSVFTVSFEIRMPQDTKNSIIILWRYIEAVTKLLLEEECNAWTNAEIIKIQAQKIIIKLLL